jgi:hypothetical protein
MDLSVRLAKCATKSNHLGYCHSAARHSYEYVCYHVGMIKGNPPAMPGDPMYKALLLAVKNIDRNKISVPEIELLKRISQYENDWRT